MKRPKHLEHINRHAAGIDIGSKSHFAAVPEGIDETPVREFSTFTGDLEKPAEWLISCGITTVAMESTGVYRIPVFEILEHRGLEVKLVNAHHVKNVPGRKGVYPSCLLCTTEKHPGTKYCITYIQNAKSVDADEPQLHNVVTDITGTTGMRIIKAILDGERDPEALASMRDPPCRNSESTIARSLEGNYRPEHLFALQQAVELYEFYQTKIADCVQRIMDQLKSFDDSRNNAPPVNVGDALVRMSGADLTSIDGIDTNTALKVLAEIGTDMSRRKSSKHFASWLGLSPGTKISGGKVLSGATKPAANKAGRHTAHGGIYPVQFKEHTGCISETATTPTGRLQGNYRLSYKKAIVL